MRNHGIQINRNHIFMAGLQFALLLLALLWICPVSAKADTVLTDTQYTVLRNIIGGVESGGQVYGQRRYAAYAGPYTNSSLEVTVTLGWPQFYGTQAETLIRRIRETDPSTFAALDPNGQIAKALAFDWVQTRWNPSAEEQQILIAMIATDTGKAVQDQMFDEIMQGYAQDCARDWTTEPGSVMMDCEIRHLGGKKAADRIMARAKASGTWSVSSVLVSLKEDQADTSNNNQVGDSKYWSRHALCAAWIQQYAGVSGSGASSSAVVGEGSVPVYRLYNPNSGEHFFTESGDERSLLVSAGWRYEAEAWQAPAGAGAPVYRLYNPNAGDHHYTASADERDILTAAGWRYEGVAFLSDSQCRVPVYRLYNPNCMGAGAHHETVSADERDWLVSLGWRYEGVAWYGI